MLKKVIPFILFLNFTLLFGCEAKKTPEEEIFPSEDIPAEEFLSSEEELLSEPAETLSPTPAPSPLFKVEPDRIVSAVETYLTLPVPVLLQLPEIPCGCEIVALAIDLRYLGYPVDKVALAKNYLPFVNYYGGSPGPDLNEVFAGDPFDEDSGRVCFAPVILSAANRYLLSLGDAAHHVAVNITGASPSLMYRLVSSGIPVIVWTTILMEPRVPYEGWITVNGNYQEYSLNDHCAVLIGTTEDTVILSDPIVGIAEYSKEAFESVTKSRNYMSVVLIENGLYLRFLREMSEEGLCCAFVTGEGS